MDLYKRPTLLAKGKVTWALKSPSIHRPANVKIITSYDRFFIIIKFFISTLCDVTIVAKRAMERLKSDHNFDTMVHLIAYADDVSALVIGQTEAEIQKAVDILMEEFFSYFS